MSFLLAIIATTWRYLKKVQPVTAAGFIIKSSLFAQSRGFTCLPADSSAGTEAQ
jgi:hypothetical protein